MESMRKGREREERSEYDVKGPDGSKGLV